MSSRSFHFPATGVQTTNEAMLLGIDDVSLPLKPNLVYFLTKPTVRDEPVLTPSRDNRDAPDFGEGGDGGLHPGLKAARCVSGRSCSVTLPAMVRIVNVEIALFEGGKFRIRTLHRQFADFSVGCAGKQPRATVYGLGLSGF